MSVRRLYDKQPASFAFPQEDEAFIALNIRGRSFVELLAPLDLNQVAPLGFLLLEKLAVRLLGGSLVALFDGLTQIAQLRAQA